MQCQKNIEHAIQTEEGLGIEYDEDICCAVCRAVSTFSFGDFVDIHIHRPF